MLFAELKTRLFSRLGLFFQHGLFAQGIQYPQESAARITVDNDFRIDANGDMRITAGY